MLGAALDGGYWASACAAPIRRRSGRADERGRRPGVAQRVAARELGLRTAVLPQLRDVDTIDDARAVAADAPATRFAADAGEHRGSGMTAATAARAEGRLPADRLYGRLLATAAQTARRRASGARARALARRDARAAAARPLARRARRPRPRGAGDRRAAGARPRLRARAATSRRFARPARKASASTSPPSPSGSRAGGARRRSGATSSGPCPAPAATARCCCSTATSASAARPTCCCGAPASCSRRGARRSWSSTRPAARPSRPGIRLEAHGAVSEWFAWARVGVDGIAPLAARGGLEYAGLLAVEGRWIAVLRRP